LLSSQNPLGKDTFFKMTVLDSETGETVWTYTYRHKGKKAEERAAKWWAFRFKEAMFPEQAAADREAAEARRQRHRRSLSQASPEPEPEIRQQLCYGRYPVPAGRYLTFPFQVTG